MHHFRPWSSIGADAVVIVLTARPCGRIMCADCSTFLFFTTSQRKHRVCLACSKQPPASLTSQHTGHSGDGVLFADSDADVDRDSAAVMTPASVASESRGKLRGSIFRAMTPSHKNQDSKTEKKKKERRNKAKTADDREVSRGSQKPVASNDGANAEQAGAAIQGSNAALFSTTEDNWFSEPTNDDGGVVFSRKGARPPAASNNDYHFYTEDLAEAEPARAEPRTAADEWQDRMKATFTKADQPPQSRTGVNGFSGISRMDDADDDSLFDGVDPSNTKTRTAADEWQDQMKVALSTANARSGSGGGGDAGYASRYMAPLDDDDLFDDPAPSLPKSERTPADEWRDQMKSPIATANFSLSSRVAGGGDIGYGFRRHDLSEQYRYDGGALNYDDDDVMGHNAYSDDRPSMPRPDLGVVNIAENPNLATERIVPAGDEMEERRRRNTLKINLKGLFHGKPKSDKTDSRKRSKTTIIEQQKSSEAFPKAAAPSADERMTLDELEASAVLPQEVMSADAQLRAMVPPSAGASMKPTFYDDDADDLVVDDSPGFFEASMAMQLAEKKKQEKLQEQMAQDAAWVNGVVDPPSTSGQRVSSEQESFSIVEVPSRGASSPESTSVPPHGDGTGKEPGFAGALKRFFGMSTVKSSEKPVSSSKSTPPDQYDSNERREQVTITEHSRDGASTELGGATPFNTAEDVTHTVLGLTSRSSMGDMVPLESADRLYSAENSSFRNTVSGALDPRTFQGDSFLQPQRAPSDSRRTKQRSNKSLKRRDTFDDLFESPKAIDRHLDATANQVAPSTQSWGHVSLDQPGSYAVPQVGVSRFDAYRDDRDDPVNLMADYQGSRPASGSHQDGSHRHSLERRRESRDSFGSPKGAFTWSNMHAAGNSGTATYALPPGVESRDTRLGGDRFGGDYEDRSPSHTIMQDLGRNSMFADSRRSQAAEESVDDIFAQFERPNDYVFDPASGSYVPSRLPPRGAQRSSEQQRTASRGSIEVAARPSKGRRSSSSHKQEYEQSSREVYAPHSASDAESNESDDIIVDKISSLEGELAALKKLIKRRKGGHINGAGESRGAKLGSTVRSRQSVHPRKESIFDGDSSESDREAPTNRWSSSRPLKSKGVNKRKDSFAGLFDEEEDDTSGLAGAGGYDALFQTGQARSDESDEGDRPTRRATKRKSSKKGSKQSSALSEAREDDGESSDDEAVLGSLKDGRQTARQRRRSTKDRSSVARVGHDVEISTADDLVARVETTPSSRSNSHSRDEADSDSIDALFDSRADADMTHLFGGEADDETVLKQPQTSSVTPSSTRSLVSSPTATSFVAVSAISGDGAASGAVERDEFSDPAVVQAPVASSIPPWPVGAEDDSDEEFSINWKKIKSTKARRRTQASSASTLFDSDPIDADNIGTSVNLFDVEDTKTDDDSGLGVTGKSTLSSVALELSDDSDSTAVAPTRVSSRSTSVADELPDVAYVVSPTAEPRALSNAPVVDEHASDDSIAPVDHDEVATSQRAPTLTVPAVDVVVEETVAEPQEINTPTIPASLVFTSSKSTIVANDEVEEESFDIFDRTNDFDVHSLVDRSAPSNLDVTANLVTAEDDDVDEGVYSDDGADDDVSFSFEVRSRKKTTQASPIPPSAPTSTAAPAGEDDAADASTVVLGKYRRATPPPSAMSSDESGDELKQGVDETMPPEDAELSAASPSADAFDADWQAMQEQAKERKKKLQLKQRQAQRDKLLKKQQSKTSTAPAPSQADRKQKKKKRKENGESTGATGHKSSGRRHRHRDKNGGGDGDGRVAAPDSEPPRSLTEL